MLNRGALRVIDANFNRAKEGLRVVEDVFRFVFEHDGMRKKTRNIRHALERIRKEKVIYDAAVVGRNTKSDLGRHLDSLETQRKNTSDILYSNFQRAKESLRVLEEFLKLVASVQVSQVKRLRYRVYALEKEALILQPSFQAKNIK